MRFYTFLLFLFFSHAIFSQEVETLNFYSNKNFVIENWELYLIKQPHDLPGAINAVKIKDSKFSADSAILKDYTGVCWFKKTFKADSSFRNKHIFLQLTLVGAAEIFFDGRIINKIGIIGNSEATEMLDNTDEEFAGITVEENKIHELLIRYSNHKIAYSYDKKGEQSFGISVTVRTSASVIESLKEDVLNSSIGMSFLVFFATLCFVHFMIFLFNRNEKSNLYYSLFCLFVSVLILSILFSKFSEDASAKNFVNFLVVFMPLFIFILLPFMFRSFFRLAIPKWSKVLLAFAAISLIFIFIHQPTFFVLLFTIILFGLIESIRILFMAIKRKVPGARIMGFGMSFFIIMTSVVLVASVSGKSVTINNPFWGIFVLVFFVLSVVSIPISITILLARNISITTKSLAKKLVEVEELSSRSIEQEKEKQLLLQNQNVMLEQQVTARTVEISEQKKIIEEKNKDIIDSINYARRIQAAMLPEESFFKSVFPNSFILYQPRDIVSGDFYYATELNGQKLVIAADCTGHGVPGALMSMVGSNIINKLTRENSILEPKAVLESLHTQLRQALKQDQKGSANRDGMDAAAVLINGKEIIYAGANRPLIYFDKENKLEEIKATKTPIGGSHIEIVTIEQHHIPLQKVNEFFLFSDGFADQFGGPEGKKLMVSKFKVWLSQVISMPLKEQHDFLLEEFTNWKKDTEQVDDVLVIGIRISDV